MVPTLDPKGPVCLKGAFYDKQLGEHRTCTERVVRFVVLAAPFYVNSRAELRNGVRHSIRQFQTGLHEPPVERPRLIRKPFKIMLYFLFPLVLVSILLGGRQ